MNVLTGAIEGLAGMVGVPLPLNRLCYLEQTTSRLIDWPKPHAYLCVIEKPPFLRDQLDNVQGLLA